MSKKVKEIMWISRHKMTYEQMFNLRLIYGEKIVIIQVDKTFESADEIVKEINNYSYFEYGDDFDEKNPVKFDVIAAVLPIELVAELMTKISIPVIFSKNVRLIIKGSSSEVAKVVFCHSGWYKYNKVNIEIEKLN